MIESLGEHGVVASDLVPALMTTHTVKNPEFDPAAKKQAETEAARKALEKDEEDVSDTETEAPPPPYQPRESPTPRGSSTPSSTPHSPSKPSPPEPTISHKPINPFGDDDEDEPIPSTSQLTRPASARLPSFDDDEGDIGAAVSSEPKPVGSAEEEDGDIGQTASPASSTPSSGIPLADQDSVSTNPTVSPEIAAPDPGQTPRKEDQPLPGEDNAQAEDKTQPPALPSLPGVSTSLTSADEVVTLDIRWTVVCYNYLPRAECSRLQLCDLFLVLVADSIYDARSRVFLIKVAEALGFEWLDVVRFENRVTDALEISENMEKTEQGEIIEGRRKGAMRKRYAMMGAAAVGKFRCVL